MHDAADRRLREVKNKSSELSMSTPATAALDAGLIAPLPRTPPRWFGADPLSLLPF
jgi:hypothetical protein